MERTSQEAHSQELEKYRELCRDALVALLTIKPELDKHYTGEWTYWTRWINPGGPDRLWGRLVEGAGDIDWRELE